MSNSKVEQSLWAERYGERSLEKKGPFSESVEATRLLLTEAQKRHFLHEVDTVSTCSPVKVPETYDRDKDRQITGEVALPKNGDGINVALSVTEENGVALKSFYTITSAGEVVDNDALETVEDTEVTLRLSKVLQETGNNLRYRITEYDKEKLYKRQQRIKWAVGSVSVAAGVGLLAIGASYGIRTWIIQPQEAAQAHRQEYDAQNHTLPGEGVTVSEGSFSLISSSDFNAIPNYGGDDKNLENPRKIALSYDDGCDTFETSIPNGANLHVALPKSSPYRVDHFVAYEKGNQLTVCLAEELPSTSKDDIDIAVQAIPTK